MPAMASIIKKIDILRKSTSTFRVGLLQAKAFRILQQCTMEYLQKYKISPIYWAFLGLLNDRNDGARPSDAADELGVEAPFVTIMVKELSKRGFLIEKTHKDDNRAKIITLTLKGKEFVKTTEVYLRKEMRFFANGITPKEFINYLTVLTKIIENSNSHS